MDMTVILIVVAAIAALFSFVAFGKMKSAAAQAADEVAKRAALEGKLNAIKQEASTLREDNQRKTKLLDEARDNARKKLRKDAQKSDTDTSTDDGNSDSEVDRLKRTLSAMESQIRSMKDSADAGIQASKANLDAAHAKEIAALNGQLERLEDQLSQAKGETNKRRQNVAKQLATPIDLATVPSELVSELSRLMRKTEQHEKMHGILQGKHQLAQERYQELQRRYFAVCRELALVALPKAESTDEEARKLAESVVEASDSLSMTNHHEAPATDAPESTEGAGH